MAGNITELGLNGTLPYCEPEAIANATLLNETLTDCVPRPVLMPQVDTLTIVIVLLYGLICATGLLGNGLVIFVIIRYTKNSVNGE